ncbi:MAG TPA: nucleotidyltransferase family protein [Rhizomicrobium sp.]|nr:nucleotidyltransferase family protein [Rhizomicrobium sp.]
MPARRDALLPSLAQELLLRAALARDGEEACALFEQWLAVEPFDGPHDEGSFRLLPLVWKRLSQASVPHPLLPRLKGVFRSNWVKMTRRIQGAAAILAALEAEGIGTMIGKGLPLALAYYPAPALRPMSDVDIIVPFEDAPRASALLERDGFSVRRQSWATERRLHHALMHVRADGTEVDLHWHVLYDCPNGAADSYFWSRAVPIDVGSARSLRPAASDLLLQTIVHGLRSNPSPPFRWVADAAMILGSNEAIDWAAIEAFAEEQGLTKRLQIGLAYLRAFALPIPPALIERLAARSSWLEPFELAAMRRELRSPAWRHARRAAYLLRLLKWDPHRGTLLLALMQALQARRTSAAGLQVQLGRNSA